MKLPEDVAVEILSRLSAKSLIRFKCVCKSWNALLNDPIFISKHHKNMLSSEEGQEVLLISRRNNVTNERVISLLKHDGNVVDQDLPTFLNDKFGHVRLIGPCNGIICLYGYTDNIALWNPSIRDFKILPPSSVPRPLDAKVRGGDIGIGFDSMNYDLKVVQILFCISFDRHLIYQVEIYSSRKNSWRKHESIMPANIVYYNLWSMVHKNELFCWWAQDDNVEVILSFDTSKETFQKTPLPSDIEVLGGQRRITRAIVPLKESITLFVYNLQGLQKTFEIWAVNELGGNPSCWNKLTSIGPLSSVERPLGFWNNDELILESRSGELVVYKRTNHEIKNLGLYGKRNRLEVVVHEESLFSVR